MFKPISPKIDFPQMERDLLLKWQEKNIVEKYLRKNNQSKRRFSFFDGPITANNPMGVHHGWGRTYKDLWQRFYNMRGYKQRFQNGFDCQGLWVEVEVEKELGIKNKKEIEDLVHGDKKASIAKFVDLCKERVLTFSKIQTEQSKRLGYFMDWDNSYYTMSDENNYMIWHFLKVCHEKGWIYKGKDSVPWCPRCETAISQHEMLTEDYKELTHETVFFKLPAIDKDFSFVAWTTTPWTIPANSAIAVNPKFKYRIWENSNTLEKILIVNQDEEGKAPLWNIGDKYELLQDVVFRDLNKDGQWIHKEEVDDILGKDLIGLKYKAPFDNFPIVETARAENPQSFHTVVDGSKIVVASEGTGILHVAPGAGKEDFDLGKKEHLPIISPIDETAVYVEGLGEFSGKNAKKHPELIIDYLRDFENGKYLLKKFGYTHRYPACWRCKTELVWRVTDEWYIAMDRPEKTSSSDGKTLREQMVETSKMIDWHPKFGLDRELDWLENMHDWLISKKNRYWGLALPIYECQECGSFEIIGSYEELEEKAVIGWEKLIGHSPHKPYIDEVKIKCKKCGEIISRVDDVGNVWLDAGIIPFSTLIDPKTKKLSYTTDKKYWDEWFPADFVTESFPGQFKNWFYSLIAMSTVLEKRSSFKTLLGYASMLAEDGRPMHKSWGNSIEFNEGADKMGVDVMRWLYVLADTEQNLLFGYKKADETRRKFHLMLWNIYNFFITYANIDGWKLDTDHKQNVIGKNVLDKWIISRLNTSIKTVTKSLEKYSVQDGALTIEEFVGDLSLWYVRRSRDRVGPTAIDELDRNECYQTLYLVLMTLSKLLAPFMPFLADEIYVNLTNSESVHLTDWPSADEKLINEDLEKQMQKAREIAEVGHAQRKKDGIKVKIPIGQLNLDISGDYTDVFDAVWEIVLLELNVKNILLKSDSTGLNEKMKVPKKFVEFTPESLENEGKARDIIRKIQEERKKIETHLDEKINVSLPDWPKEFEDVIKRAALVKNLYKKDVFAIERI